MQWHRRLWLWLVSLTVIVAVLGLEAMGAVAAPDRSGATYRGSGR
jgi:hypothetical protein